MAVTPQDVESAYQALETGDRSRIEQWWAADMRWLVPGHHRLAGWWEGLDGFLEFMGHVGALSGGSFSMQRRAVMVGGDVSADYSYNVGSLAEANGRTSAYDALEIDVIHMLEWRDGQVVRGRGAIFGDGTARFDQFWSQLRPDGSRAALL